MFERIAFSAIGLIVVMGGCGRSENDKRNQPAAQAPPQSTPGQSPAQAQAAASTRPAQPAAAREQPNVNGNGAAPVR